jgi:hypothetical protein
MIRQENTKVKLDKNKFVNAQFSDHKPTGKTLFNSVALLHVS